MLPASSANTSHRYCPVAAPGTNIATKSPTSWSQRSTNSRQGSKRRLVGRQVFSPLDLERTFGLVGGDIMHGALTLDQLFSARPVLGHGNYRAPIQGLYMCGSGTHPGGGVTGAPGHNAAREILKDLKRR